MSDWICTNCGHIFDEGEVFVEREYHDEIPGGFYEEWNSCPSCGSYDIEKAATCKKCGGSFMFGKLLGHAFCRECVDDYMTFENLKRYASEDIEPFAEWMEDDIKKAAHRSGTSMTGKWK